MFKKQDIDRLIAYDASPAITLMLPTHMGNREVRQDRIRLRNMSAEAVARVAAMGADRQVAEQLMAPVRALADDDGFWLEQSPGLTIFIAPGLFEVMRLPFSVSEELVVGHRFHLRHLLPALEADHPFLILTLTARRARLYDAARYRLVERNDGEFPILVRERPDELTDMGRQGNGTGRHMVTQEERKTEFFDFLSHTADVLARQTNPRDIPIVLVAMSEFVGHFRNVAKLRNLVDDAITENPDSLGEQQLHELAYARVRPLFLARENQVLEKFDIVFGQGQKRASIDVAEVVEAARDGRIDTLFVADDTHLWGRVDPEAGLIQHNEPAPDDEELLDYAAAQTWRNGGAVRVLPRASAPFGKPVSALFRY